MKNTYTLSQLYSDTNTEKKIKWNSNGIVYDTFYVKATS